SGCDARAKRELPRFRAPPPTMNEHPRCVCVAALALMTDSVRVDLSRASRDSLLALSFVPIALATALIGADPAAAPTEASANPIPAVAGAEEAPNAWVVGGVSVGITTGILAIGRLAWWDQGTQHFHLYHEGFFGAGTYAGGTDKLGHFGVAYFGV